MSATTYRDSIRSAVRGLYRGVLTKPQFKNAMTSAIRRGVIQAWNEGAKDCDIAPDELSDDEVKAQVNFIDEQVGFVGDFADSIKDAEHLDPMLGRAELWANRYNDARNQAKGMACSDRKLVWNIGPSEKHCRDCSKYDGRVYRGKTWGEIRPQSSNLACHGFRCQCQLNSTSGRANKGKPPRMTG